MFNADIIVPSDIHSGLYRLRADFGVKTGKILHLSLFAKEKTTEGTDFWDFRRVIARGTTVLNVK